ncbi:Expansin-like EG45 domain-containing protein [Mycena sanguinolenta]|uniref:Expansin-like EG45 domain-containing protein n=1 Tax=Mycena sanguinolenta TaxID=230812 RepID=A0A8H7DM56_9AGAR|nr:Expansin-like EG45 domain-containing protein [Mycena sanguinolenta]
MLVFTVLVFCILYTQVHATNGSWIDYPADGTATMTHYTIPDGFIASCGCVGDSTKYPTAAMSQMAYGSSTAYGPACGKCFNLTLLNTYTSTPPFFPGRRQIHRRQSNRPLGGQYINFDLAYPSSAIPDDFFPSNETEYGYTDFGVWNISYQTVPCLSNWAGANNKAALGSVSDLGDSACCPANPTGNPNDTCPSYSDDNAIPPDTTTSRARTLAIPSTLVALFVFAHLFGF